MKADEVYAKLKKMIASVSVGIKNTTSTQNPDGSVTITINFTSGSPLSLTMSPVKGDKGTGIKDALIKEIQNGENTEYHLIFIDDKNNNIDAGKIPISSGGSVDLSNYTTKDNSIKSINLVDAIPTGSASGNQEKCLQLVFADDTKIVNVSVEDLVDSYDDTKVKSDINDLQSDKQDKTDNSLDTTDKTLVGAINTINGNQLDTVTFSADYKNIILNRKNGLNPYIIPIASIINNAKIAELNDVDSTNIGDGKTLIYDSSTKKHKYVDSALTDELVKMDSTTDAKYLNELIDKSTIVNDNGVLKVKKLDGQEVTIAEINHLKGLTMNVMDLVNTFANGGVKVYEHTIPTYADLSKLDRSGFIDGIKYFVYVQSDETHGGAKTTYICDKNSTSYFCVSGDHRDFTTNPIDLANEVTGKLGATNIDVDALWKLLTINDTYKTLTTKNEPFGTHGAKALYDELVVDIGKKANATDLTTHTSDTNIHITSAERTAWNKKANATDLTSHTSNTDIHITTAERTKWNKVDNKVDKTDIIDNLTSTNTDKPLSANQGKILNDKKLNKADVNKFNDLINLDSVSLKEYILENCTEEKVYHLIARSTCTDIPKANSHFYVIVEKVGSFTHKVTAKCLNTNEEYTSTYRSDSSTWYGWDKIALGDYNLKTYTDINQLGLIAPVTVGEIFNAMPNFSLLHFQVDNYSVTDAPASNGILIIDKIRSAKFSIEFKISADGAVAQNSLYIGQLKGSDASGLTWEKVCTTSELTELSLENNWNKTKARVVKNGNVVNIEISATDGTATSGTTIATLPEGFRPTSSPILIGTTEEGYGKNMKVQYFCIQPDGQVVIFAQEALRQIKLSANFILD